MILRKVVPYRNLPTYPLRLIEIAAIIWLYLDRHFAPDWVRAWVWGIFSAWTLLVVGRFLTEKYIDDPMFEDIENEEPR